MKPKMQKKLAENIRLAFDSLQSHLPYIYLKSSEGKKFHKECVRDYLKIMTTDIEILLDIKKRKK